MQLPILVIATNPISFTRLKSARRRHFFFALVAESTIPVAVMRQAFVFYSQRFEWVLFMMRSYAIGYILELSC